MVKRGGRSGERRGRRVIRSLKTIFVDRDGVINKDPGGWTKHSYVTEAQDLHILPGSLDALRLLKNSGFDIVIVSNQAGVNKGYFTREMLDRVNQRMLDQIVKRGGAVKAVYYCVHRDEDRCDCRKPKTGLFERAIRKFKIDPRETYMVGDSEVDALAAKSLGMKAIFVLSGKVSKDEMLRWKVKPDYVFENLLGAATWLIDKERRRVERKDRRKEQEKTS